MVEYVVYEEERKDPKVRGVVISSYVLPLVILNVVIFMFQMIFPVFMDNFVLYSNLIWERPWTLLSYMFLHASFAHLFFNMYALFLFGILLETKIGPKKFISLFLLSGILVGFIGTFFYSALVGASGGVMAIIGTLIVLLPKLKLLFFFIIPMDLWFAGVVFFLIDVFGLLVPSNVANLGHIVGMFTGLAYGFYLYKKKKKFYGKFGGKKTVTLEEANEYDKHYK